MNAQDTLSPKLIATEAFTDATAAVRRSASDGVSYFSRRLAERSFPEHGRESERGEGMKALGITAERAAG
jgi:hypothetical protein